MSLDKQTAAPIISNPMPTEDLNAPAVAQAPCCGTTPATGSAPAKAAFRPKASTAAYVKPFDAKPSNYNKPTASAAKDDSKTPSGKGERQGASDDSAMAAKRENKGACDSKIADPGQAKDAACDANAPANKGACDAKTAAPASAAEAACDANASAAKGACDSKGADMDQTKASCDSKGPGQCESKEPMETNRSAWDSKAPAAHKTETKPEPAKAAFDAKPSAPDAKSSMAAKTTEGLDSARASSLLLQLEQQIKDNKIEFGQMTLSQLDAVKGSLPVASRERLQAARVSLHSKKPAAAAANA